MAIFELSKRFPKEETCALTDPMQRSNRSVCADMAEARRKRRYEADFVSKLSHVEAEAAETQVWLPFAVSCGYLAPDQARDRSATDDRIPGKPVTMLHHPNPWSLPR